MRQPHTHNGRWVRNVAPGWHSQRGARQNWLRTDLQRSVRDGTIREAEFRLSDGRVVVAKLSNIRAMGAVHRERGSGRCGPFTYRW
jgi:hypothetical protein